MRRSAWLFLAVACVSVVLFVLQSRRTPPVTVADPVLTAASSASPAPKTLSVRVLSQGQPFAGARVQLFDAEHAQLIATVTSNAAGEAVFERLQAASVLAVVEHPELERRSSSLELIAGRTDISMDLARGVTLRGVVSDESNALVADIVVAAVSGDGKNKRTVKTDARGAYVIAMLSPRSLRVEVTTGRHLPYVSSVIEMPRAGMTTTHDVRLAPGRVLAGRVVDRAGKPLPGVSVGSSDPGAAATNTDADGRFELLGMGEAPVNLFASHPGFAATHERGVRPGGRGVELRLLPEASVRGRVVWPKDVHELLISVCHHDTHFDKELCVARVQLRRPDVDYVLAGLPAGRFDVVVDGEGLVTQRVVTNLSSGVVTELTPIQLATP